jgi:hypothetical protein
MELDPDDEIFLALDMKFQPYGFYDQGSGRTLNFAFRSLEKIKEFMDAAVNQGILTIQQYRTIPTTPREYYGRLKEKFGGFDLAVDPDTKVLDLVRDIPEMN